VPIFKRVSILFACTFLASCLAAFTARSQATSNQAGKPAPRIKIIIDTDIGDDIDDAFAVGLALQSPELEIRGITTAWGDTALRARLVDRLLFETGNTGIPVAEGIPSTRKTAFPQARYATAGPPPRPHPEAVGFLLGQIRQNPGEITLICIGPLTNIGAAIYRDPDTFRKVKQIVLMGGSIRRRYGDLGYAPDRGPEPEYNIVSDVPAAQKVFGSGVPIFMMPLDSTQLKLDEVHREILFSRGTSLTDALTLLYHEWGYQTPTLFDVMTVAYVLDPGLCPVVPMHVTIDKDGFTRNTSGVPNASVCLDSDSDRFFHFVLPRLLNSTGTPNNRAQ